MLGSCEILRALVRQRWRRSFVLPRYTPANWFECDLFEITDAGYWREYEIKMTRADFFRDKEKGKVTSWTAAWEARKNGQPIPKVHKHERLSQSDERGPHRFWFVTPAGLIKPEEVPTWAGLIEFKFVRHGWPSAIEVRKAPKLHAVKVCEKVEKHARGICYWRMHDALHWHSERMQLLDDRTVEFADGI